MPGWKTMERAKRKRKLTVQEAPAMKFEPKSISLPERGWPLERIKGWRKMRHDAGLPDTLPDFWRENNLCKECHGSTVEVVLWRGDTPTYGTCTHCNGSGAHDPSKPIIHGNDDVPCIPIVGESMTKKPEQTPSPTAKDPFYKWTVEIEVHAKWVADGFELDDASAHDMLAHRLSHAYGHELRAKVLAAPDPKQIAAEQGRKTPGYKPITDDNGEVEARPDLDVEI